MPVINLSDGSKKQVSYGSAAKLKMYLDEPDKLDNIRCENCEKKKRQCKDCLAKRAKKEEFLLQVQSIDWSDVKKSITEAPRAIDRAKLRAVLADDTLKGKAKFDAVREAMGASRLELAHDYGDQQNNEANNIDDRGVNTPVN